MSICLLSTLPYSLKGQFMVIKNINWTYSLTDHSFAKNSRFFSDKITQSSKGGLGIKDTVNTVLSHILSTHHAMKHRLSKPQVLWQLIVCLLNKLSAFCCPWLRLEKLMSCPSKARETGSGDTIDYTNKCSCIKGPPPSTHPPTQT